MTEKKRNVFLAAGAVLGIALVTALLFDYYYALNDDVLIKDIIAGVQTGTPSGYSVQTLYPISIFISLFYKLFRTVSWYGLFLCACHYGCLFLLIYKSLFFTKGKKGKAAVLFLAAMLTGGLFWWELVYVQYTVTCALLAGLAAFWLYTAPESEGLWAFVRYNAVTVLAVILAFCIRSEMLLLCLPFLGAAGICRWLREREKGKTLGKYLVTAGILLAGMGMMFLADKAAYGSGEWQEFNSFFDARTEIYDFYGLPEYEENAEGYRAAGIEEKQYALLSNYNFGIDKTIDTSMMERLQAYAGEVYHENHPAKIGIREAVWNYFHILFDKENQYFQADFPWNSAVILGYISVILSACLYGQKRMLWELPVLLSMRSISWMYILYRGRMPGRITHSLYLVELLVLLAMLVTMTPAKGGEKKKYGQVTAAVLLGGFLLFQVPDMYHNIASEQQSRIQKNESNLLLQQYCRAHDENYYYVDVMSTVDFSEKMFQKADNSMRNYDIIGGWLCKSPISGQEPFTYFITDKEDDITWLLPYYEMEKTEGFGPEGKNGWSVYRRNDK